MGIDIWHIWVIIAVLLFIAEIKVPNFIFGTIAVGCLFAGIVSAFDFGIKIQFIGFIIGTLIAFFRIRPFTLKYLYKKTVETNMDALVGKIGRVIETINNAKNEGRIALRGDDWKAETENNEIVNVGEKVEVLQVDSTILIVKSIK
jgi:membrane protein implicated in regulation of membrane protease activity